MLSKKIRAIRKERGLTIKNVAKLVGVSEQAISQYERGIREPNLSMIDKIAEALNVSRLDLLETEYNSPIGKIKIREEYIDDKKINDKESKYIDIDTWINKYIDDSVSEEDDNIKIILFRRLMELNNVKCALSEKECLNLINEFKLFVEFRIFKINKEKGEIENGKEKS